MRRVVLLILCCHASGAMAKDPPRPESHVTTKGCEWAGPGFAKVEGSSTCVKVSGSVRAEFETSK